MSIFEFFVSDINKLVALGIPVADIAPLVGCTSEDLAAFLKGDLKGEPEEALVGRLWKNQKSLPDEKTIQNAQESVNTTRSTLRRVDNLRQYLSTQGNS